MTLEAVGQCAATATRRYDIMRSMKPINTSIFDFPTLLAKGCVYVDKTAQIYELVKPSGVRQVVM